MVESVESEVGSVTLTVMLKKLSLLVLFLTISCGSVQTEKKINFSKDLTFEEFKTNLKVYVDNSEYPNIDE